MVWVSDRSSPGASVTCSSPVSCSAFARRNEILRKLCVCSAVQCSLLRRDVSSISGAHNISGLTAA